MGQPVSTACWLHLVTFGMLHFSLLVQSAVGTATVQASRPVISRDSRQFTSMTVKPGSKLHTQTPYTVFGHSGGQEHFWL